MAALSCGRILLDTKTIFLADHLNMVIGSADQLCQGTFPKPQRLVRVAVFAKQ
jgi:hypothetical protein